MSTVHDDVVLQQQKIEYCEAENYQLQMDIKSANKRIEQLKSSLEESVVSDDE